MTVYYVDDGGSATDPYDTWAKAATSLSALDDAKTIADTDIIYIGHNHVCQFTHAANRSIAGPTTGTAHLISATQGSDPPTYQASSTDQIDTTEGAYSLTFTGGWSIHGVRMKSGAGVAFTPALGTTQELFDCTIAPAANGTITPTAATSRVLRLNNVTIDLTADGTTNRSGSVFGAMSGGHFTVSDLSFVNAAYRTGVIFDEPIGVLEVNGADFSGFTNATACELVNPNHYVCSFSNCKTAATWTPFSTTAATYYAMMVNVGPADAPTYLAYRHPRGDVVSSTAIYRTNGASVEDTSVAWLITTESNCSETQRFVTPWIYGRLSGTGSKTFDVYITNDTADFDNDEVWLEIECMATADSAQSTKSTNHRTITATPAAQTDDTTSTWNGAGPSFTYKQKLSVTATVGEEGMYRARVVVGVASIAGSRYFYVDPKVTVS